MVGKKGRSGRKPDQTGLTARAVALYIPMFQIGKKWIAMDWFIQFKKIYGSGKDRYSPMNWQEKIRSMIRQEVIRYETYNMWKCKCIKRLDRHHFRHASYCPRCLYEPKMIERHKTEAEVRRNTPVPSPSELETMLKCPHCKSDLELHKKLVANTMTTVLRCYKCNPKKVRDD